MDPDSASELMASALLFQKRMSKSSDVQTFIPENAPVLQESVLNSEHNLQRSGHYNKQVPVQKVVQFIPKLKSAGEMEARRRIRMAGMTARRGGDPSASAQPPKPDPTFDDTLRRKRMLFMSLNQRLPF
ncbi:hypothetical protein BT96DRAFT_982774 [Gymnopus androsaceus JB14]|uniref:Uncharacterized protein n=1 Tax=Gymnopus androsaceus JB14 TaxID=1447944 RepID=A0A6A4GBK6_9AGAR|nr:hypothetical protein BT96DRAFT_982774 [Gymnopus androsaceus JB14]